MNKLIVSIIMLLSFIAAFLMLTVNVDVLDIGGISGTMVVQAGISKEDMEQTITALRFGGVFWLCVALVSLKSIF